MSAEEPENQDHKIELAQKVGRAAGAVPLGASCSAADGATPPTLGSLDSTNDSDSICLGVRVGPSLLPLHPTAVRRCQPACSSPLQRFLLRTQDVADVDRQQLQREIMGIMQQHGECCAGSSGSATRNWSEQWWLPSPSTCSLHRRSLLGLMWPAICV